MLGLKGEGTATPSPTEALLLPGLGSSSGRLKCHPWQVLGDILTSCRDGKTQKLKRTNSQIFFTNNLIRPTGRAGHLGRGKVRCKNRGGHLPDVYLVNVHVLEWLV